jgi:hypothetical protein
MSDATDAVAVALAKNKQLAASCLVRKQDAEAELAKLRAAKEQGLDDPALDARIEAAAADVADADVQLAAALDEMKKLRALAAQAPSGAAIAAAAKPDEIIQTLEEQALDNVRAHIAEQDAQARLGAELSGEPAPQPAAAKPSPKQKADEAEAEARRKFEEMRARMGKPAAAAPSGDPDKPGDPTKPAPPKKTL